MNFQTSKTSVKPTSYQYSDDYQNNMVEYFRKQFVVSDENYDYKRLEFIKSLIEKAWSSLSGKGRGETIVVDIGCSVGGCAIPISLLGYQVHGVDFDAAAIKIAWKLNREMGASAVFHQMDVSDWKATFPPIDIALSADLFEHLHDDELGGLLQGLKRNMNADGILVFYTVPQAYDYIFWRAKNGKRALHIPWLFLPFVWLNDEYFTRVVRVAALCFDIYSVITKGKTYKERIKRADHPNPLTRERLTDILERAGFELLMMDSQTMEIAEQMNLKQRRLFRKFSVTHRMLYGMAKIRKLQHDSA
jgi:2-polyprenyl-3-methyl-5-hydroxy-6-metoxy-1,4-benzoquinol methylase